MDAGYSFAKRRIADLNEQQFTALWEEIGSYSVLRRADGMAPNVGGYSGDHAFVLVGSTMSGSSSTIRSRQTRPRYSGERGTSSASLRAVRFELASVRRMTSGDGDLPRGDCFMVPGPSRQ